MEWAFLIAIVIGAITGSLVTAVFFLCPEIKTSKKKGDQKF